MSLVKITSDGITDGSIVNADLHSGANIASSKLADSGVTAGSYGSATAIPAVTVNAKGIVTAVSTNSVNTTTNLDVSTSTTAVTVTSSTGNNATISEASGSAAGVMSVAHHDKLDGIATGATNVTNTNQLTNGAGFITATLTNEQVQDIVGGMVSSNTESGITVTYQDGDGTLDFAVASQTDNNFTNADHSKLDGIEAGATADQSASEIVALIADQTIAPSTIDMEDNEQIKLGTADDLQLVHDGTDSIINNSTNNLFIRSGSTHLQALNAEDMIVAEANGSVELYHDNSKKLQTQSWGVQYYGDLHATDGSHINLGSSNDLQLLHNGSHSIVKNNTGDFFLAGDSVKLVNAAINEDMLVATANGSVSLYHNNSKKIETTSSGATISGNLISTHSNGQVECKGDDGCIEITRTSGGAFIDFKNSTGEDFDARISENNGGFEFTGNNTINGTLDIGGSSVAGNEGGEIHLTYAPNSSLNGSAIVFDQVINSIRFFENGSPHRGFLLDFTTGGNGASTKIWHAGNDGASSGLDADFLDGQHGSHYLNYNNLSNRPSIPSVSSSQLAKAFVNLDQRSTQSIRNSYNVSSLTDNGTGKTTVNFSSGVGSNPTCQATSSWGDGSRAGWVGLTPDHTPNSSNVRVFSQQPSTYAFMDAVFLCVTVHRS